MLSLTPLMPHLCILTQLYTSPCMQATSVSAINLHTINILCYALIEGYLWLEFGEAAFMRGGVTHALLMLLLCSALPLAANVAEEVQSRRAFLNRRAPGLCPSLHRLHCLFCLPC